MKKTILYFLLLISNTICLSQETLINYQSTNNDSLKVYFKDVHKTYLNNFPKEYKSKIKDLLKNQDKYFINKLNDSVYQFDKIIESHLGDILSNIYKANPSVKTDNFKFFLKNAISPNASCYGNGVFEINTGLFPLLESDDELAFILCHEIAHYKLEHSIKATIKHIALQNSKETTSKLKDINKLNYGRNRALFKLINEFNYNVLNHSKKAELEADSLGYDLYKKTKYNQRSSIAILKKLGGISEIQFNTPINLDSLFNFQSYPFKEYWLQEEQSMFTTKKRINEFSLSSDTIQTHPAIPLRIKKLEVNLAISKEITEKKSKLRNINKLILPKNYQLTLDWKRYDISMYILIDYLKKNLITQEEYVAKMSSLLLNIYSLKKEHNLNKHVPLTKKFSKEKELDKIRKFINTIETNELRKLGLQFCLENNLENNKEFNINLNQFKAINKL